MDNLCAGIRASSDQHKKGAGYRGLSASIAPDFHPHQGVAGFTGIGGSFRMEWVAALPWNQWQAWSGIRNPMPACDPLSFKRNDLADRLLLIDLER
jgi:hypothetical protein